MLGVSQQCCCASAARGHFVFFIWSRIVIAWSAKAARPSELHTADSIEQVAKTVDESYSLFERVFYPKYLVASDLFWIRRVELPQRESTDILRPWIFYSLQ